MPLNFNSRPCARGDDTKRITTIYYCISIPAPARGATKYEIEKIKNIYYFNSRPCARGDGHKIYIPSQDTFQFPPLREGRHEGSEVYATNSRFQFPPLREGRQKRTEKKRKDLQFQFPPLREGRPDVFHDNYLQYAISIPAPARGATYIWDD